MTVRVLGAVSVTHEGELKPVAKAGLTVLAILVAAGPDGLTDEQIAHEIWGEEPAEGWYQNLRGRMSRLRKAFEYDQIRSGNRHYALNLAADDVDAWQLLEHAHVDLDTIDDDHLQSLATDPPFPMAVDSRLVARTVADIEAARIELLDRLGETHLDRVTPTLLAATATLSKTSLNEHLVRAAIELHARSGNRRSAIDLAEQAVVRLTTELDFEPAAVVQLRSKLLADASATDAPKTETGRDIPASPPRWIGPTPDLRQLPSVDRPALLADATAALNDRPIVLTGESGTGKTQLAQQLATLRHRSGRHVVWTVASRDGTTAYGPFLAALPAWSDDIASAAGPTTDPAVTDARRAAAFVRRLHQACPDHPITIVVDDAHWLDSRSTHLVDFLAKSADQQIELIIAGRHDGGPTAWEQALDGFTRAGATTLEVGPFDHSELINLVAAIHPASTSRQRNELAKHLIELRANLPLLASELIATADPETLTLAPLERSTPRWTDVVWTGAVSATTRDLATAAALTGVTWTFGEVLELTGTDPDHLLDATGELEDAGLVNSEARPDQFSFRHALIHDAFAACATPAQRRTIHQRAAGLAAREDRVHDRARHLLAAGPLVKPTELGDALAASAQAHLDDWSWLEAVTAFTAADRVGADLDARTLSAYAYAIERSGGDPDTMRRRGFETARRNDDPATMLDVALGGADSGEMLEATETRLELLELIPHDRLAPHDQRRLDLARCRELGIVGRHDEARQLHTQLAKQGEDVATWLAIWTSLVGSPPSTWPAQAPDAATAADPATRARMRNALCERALTLGRRDEFDRELASLADEPAAQDDPNRRWALLLLQATQAGIDGDFTQAAELADRGFAIGAEFGLGGAFPARSAQLFAHHWLLGSHGDLVPVLDMAPPDVRDSLLATAAYGSALLEHEDRRNDGLDAVNGVFARLDDVLLAVQTPVAALLAGQSMALSQPQRDRLRELLEPHRGAAILLGAGIAHLGPATRSLASLANSDAEQRELLAAAIAEADEWRLPTWSVRCRLDLYQLNNDEALLGRAREIAAGSHLGTLLP